MSRGLFILNSFILFLISTYSYSNNQTLGIIISERFNHRTFQERPVLVQRPQNVVEQNNTDECHWADGAYCCALCCCGCACYHYPCAMLSCSVASCCGCACYTGAKCMPIVARVFFDNCDTIPQKME